MRLNTDPPLPGAEVLLDGVSVGLTGADGSLTIAEVMAGTHTIEARKDGYTPDSATISVPETTSVTLTLTFIKLRTEVRISSDKTSYTVGETAYLTLGLYDEYGNLIDHGRIVDYTVTLNGAWYAGWGQYGDDPSRGLLLNSLGTYMITGNFPGDDTYEPSSNTITITAITLTYTVVVTVTGSQISGALIYLDGSYVGATDAVGRLTIPNVAAGSHTIRASKSGYYDASKTITVPETTSVTLTLSPVIPEKIRTSIKLSSDKTSYAVGEKARLTQGLYDAANKLISGRVVDYNVTCDGAWYAGWGQYSDDPSRELLLSKAGTYMITGSFAGDATYKPSSKTITITARKIGTSIKLSSNKTSYAVGERAYLTQGLYDDAGNLISDRTVDYTVTLNGAWYAGWGQYSDDPYRTLILSKSGTYAITGRFAGDETYGSSSKTITVTATAPEKIGTSIKISPNKTSYSVGEIAYLTLGLYDEYGRLIDHSRIVDYTVLCNGSWYAGWGQYGDDTSRTLLLNRAGTYSIKGSFAGDDIYESSSKTVTVTAG